MSERITLKIDGVTMPDPRGRSPEDDPWREFRDIERIHMGLEFHFRHSLGKVSRFFLELENRRLMATRCPTCAKVWMPPRPLCADDLTITEWLELPGNGVLEAASLSAYTLTTGGGEDQLVLGYVRLEGADTLMLQQVKNYRDPSVLEPGLPVNVAWSDKPVGHPMESFWFEPGG